jgi:hypothetical protein
MLAAPLHQDVLKLGSKMLQFIGSIERLDTPDEVLDSLQKATHQATPLNVLGAVLFPVRWGDWGSLKKGKTVFLHKGAPHGWWDEQVELNRKHPGPGFMLAQMSLAPFTMSEVMRMLEPLGVERESFDMGRAID